MNPRCQNRAGAFVVERKPKAAMMPDSEETTSMSGTYVKANPYPWPYNGDLRPANTALVIIDMQTDFCGRGGYVDAMGYDLSLTRAPIQPISRVLAPCGKRVTRLSIRAKATAPILPICRPTSAGVRSASARGSATLDRAVASWFAAKKAGRSSPSWRRCAGEPIIDKPGKGSFYATDLDLLLRRRGVENLILTGITTDVCVHTTMRDANDRGFECLLLEDCCGATELGNHLAAIKMVTMQGGVFGAVARSEALLEALP